MLASITATRLGISNEPTSKEIENNIIRCAQFLQELRDKINKSIRVFSCYRSPKVNKAVGGSKTSAHMQGLAVDFEVTGMSNKELAEYIRDNFTDYDQIILEFPPGGWVHVGIATETSNRKQNLTAKKKNGKTVYSSGFKE